MPIYEYQCSKCSHQFEKLRKISEAGQPAPCPKCTALAEQKISSGVDAHASRKQTF